MSIKTLRKRIALVAVSALGVGLLSVAPASAAQETTVSIALNKGTIVAGSEGVTVTVVNTSTVAAAKETALVITTPTGSKVVEGSEIDATGITNTSATATTTYVVSASVLLEPGTYTFTGVSGGADSDLDLASEAIAFAAVAASAKSTTLTVLSPASLTGVGIATDGAYAVDSQPTIRAWRPTNGVLGEIKFVTTLSADTTVVSGTVNQGSDTTSTTGSYDVYQLANTADDTAGDYAVTAWVDTNDNDVIDGSEPSANVAFSLGGSVSATVSTLTVSRSVVLRTADTTAGAVLAATGALTHVAPLTQFTVTFTALDADGYPAAATNPAVFEDTNLSDMGGTAGAATALVQVGTSNVWTKTFTSSGVGATTGFTTNTITLVNNAAATALTATYKQAYLTSETTTARLSVEDLVGVGAYSSTTGLRDDLYADTTVAAATAAAITVDKAVGTSLTFTYTGTSGAANQYILVGRTPIAGASLTNIPATAKLIRLGSDAKASWTETVASAVAAEGYTLNVYGGQSGTGKVNAAITVTFATATPTITASPTNNVLAKDGASTSFGGKLTDQFGRVLAGKTVTYSVAGRNPSTGTVTSGTDGSLPAVVVKDSSGIATTTLSTNTDTITWTYNYTTATGAAASATGTKKVTYSVTGPTVASVAIASSTANKQIDMAKVNGIPARYVTYTATVRKADNSSSGAGILCTFTGNAGDKFKGGINTSVTDADGLCTIDAFRDLAGNAEIKAAAEGISSKVALPVKWMNQGDAATATGEHDARYIKVTGGSIVAGTPFTVVATVTDRWGNPVSGVDVTFAVSGVGRLVSGETTAKETNVNGEAQIQVTSTSTEIGAMTISASWTGNQADDLAGYITTNTTVGTVGTAAAGDAQTVYQVAGVTAAVKKAEGTVTFTTAPVGVTNAEVLAAIVKLIASINKQIAKLQKLIRKK